MPALTRHVLSIALLLAAGCRDAPPPPRLDDPDPYVRRKAIIRLTTETAPAHADEILRLLREDPNPDVRAAAILGVGMARDARAIPTLAAYVRDRGAWRDHRIVALNALVAIGGPEAGRVVIDAYLGLPEDDPLFDYLQIVAALRHDDWYRTLASTPDHPERVQAAVERRRAHPQLDP